MMLASCLLISNIMKNREKRGHDNIPSSKRATTTKKKGKEMFFQFIVGPSLPAFTGLIPKLLEAKLLENVKHYMTHNEGADLLSHDFSVLPPIL